MPFNFVSIASTARGVFQGAVHDRRPHGGDDVSIASTARGVFQEERSKMDKLESFEFQSLQQRGGYSRFLGLLFCVLCGLIVSIASTARGVFQASK